EWSVPLVSLREMISFRTGSTSFPCLGHPSRQRPGPPAGRTTCVPPLTLRQRRRQRRTACLSPCKPFKELRFHPATPRRAKASAKVIQKSKPRNFSKEIFSGKAKVFANVDKKNDKEQGTPYIIYKGQDSVRRRVVMAGGGEEWGTGRSGGAWISEKETSPAASTYRSIILSFANETTLDMPKKQEENRSSQSFFLCPISADRRAQCFLPSCQNRKERHNFC
ncbi:hypothetical protein SAMN05216383_104164, partial [Prevotella sp. KH2C16]